MTQAPQPHHWHAETSKQALEALDTGPEGLSPEEATARLGRHGPNRLPAGRRRSLLERVSAHLKNLLILMLLAAAFVSMMMGHLVDAAVILAVVVVNTAIGLVQEGRAERSLDAIRAMIDPSASVIRSGRRLTIPAHEVVPGDVVLIEAGDRVAADLRLTRASSLKVQEAALTGESVAVDKAVGPVGQNSPLGDRKSMAYSGTSVAAGQGAGVAVATGPDTELGQISAMVGAVRTLDTRHSRYVVLVKVANRDSRSVITALIEQAKRLPDELCKSLTWDRGKEMAEHKRFTLATDTAVYFCDPQSPWQRGSNENTNRLLRPYFPKGTNLSVHSQERLDEIARQLNERPRKTLGYKTPAERFDACVATTN